MGVQQRHPAIGCLPAPTALLVGIAVGAALIMGLFGVGVEQLLAQVKGESQWTLVDNGPKPQPPSVIGGAVPGNRLVWGAPIALDTDTAEPDLLVISRNYDRGGDSVMYFSPSAQTIRWESASMGEEGNSWTVIATTDLVLVADQARLVALSRADGSQRWEAPLSDEIADNLCTDCLQEIGGAIVALSADGMLQAFRPADGTLLWQTRLREAVRQMVATQGLIGVPDLLEADGSTTGLTLYDPQNGQLVRQITPDCSTRDDEYSQAHPDRPGLYAPIYTSPDGKYLYWIISSSPSCLVRVEAASGTISWRSLLPDFYGFWGSNRKPLFLGDTLYVADDEQILEISAQGEYRKVMSSEDYDLEPVAVSADGILSWAKRTRGTSRMELWMIDTASGTKRWERVLQGSTPVTGSYGSGTLAAGIMDGAVFLVEQLEEPEAFMVERIGPRDGQSQFRTALQVKDASSYLRGVTWGRELFWLPINELYTVRAADGATRSRWP